MLVKVVVDVGLPERYVIPASFMRWRVILRRRVVALPFSPLPLLKPGKRGAATAPSVPGLGPTTPPQMQVTRWTAVMPYALSDGADPHRERLASAFLLQHALAVDLTRPHVAATAESVTTHRAPGDQDTDSV